jgi:glyoxylase-like metal-dependent hydrolase (beta-lactamase superfamily II)
LYFANLHRAGCEPADLAAILHTHNHSDHIGATAKLVEASGAETMIGEADAPLLAAKAPVSRLLRDGDIVEFAGTQFTFLHTPGHTRGSGVYLLEQNGVRVCFIGDAVGPFIFEDVRWEGDAEAFRSSADRMKTMVADLYLPGHPHQTMEVSPEGNPRLTREQWHRFIDDRVHIMESTISGQGA